MNKTVRLRAWAPAILLLFVTIVLLLVGVLQYQWFSKSASVEIEGTIRGLEASVRQTVIREYQIYAPLISELQLLSDLRTQDRQLALERLFRSYGPGGVTPDLLLWVGWAGTGAPLWTVREGTGPWTQRSVAGEPWAPFLGPDGFPPVQAGTHRTTSTRLQTLFIRSPDKALVILLGIDQDRFWSAYLEPALQEAFPKARARLSVPPPEQGFDPPRAGFDTRNYRFNPLASLFSGSTIPRDVTVDLPRFFDSPAREARPRPGRGELLQTLGPPATPAQIVVTLPSDSPVLSIENRLAWNWLGSTLLLVGLGAAFALVLRQSARLSALARREREFVASVSHELRTPLTVIRSAADNFTQGIVPLDKQGRYGQLILDQSLRLGRMIEEMLSFAQAEAAPAGSEVRAPLEFEAWIGELRPPLESLAAAKGVHLLWDIAGVPLVGLCDPETLRLVLENLVINAVNHAYPQTAQDNTSRVVRISLRYLVPQRLELVVEDDGRGILPREAKRVFEPFYRDQISRDQQEKGSGLGLFLAQRRVRRLGGDLKLESPWRRLDGSRKSGCRFSAVLPFLPLTKDADRAG